MPKKAAKPKIITEEIKDEVEVVETPKETLPEVSTDKATISSFRNLDVEEDKADDEKPDVVEEKSDPLPEIETPIASEEPVKKELSSDDVKSWLSEVRPDTTKEMSKSGSSFGKVFFIVLFILILGGLAFGGFYYYKSGTGGKDETSNEPVITQTQEPNTTTQPEPTKASMDLKSYKLNVLNGSGITGEAKKVMGLLVTAGFTEGKAGNASNSNYTTTEISFKKDVPNAVYEEIKKALGDGYVIEKADKDLAETSAYDIEIIVGKKK